ncbi:hypothetical protein [Enterococcus sp. AZ196]|uniref:hypothetical protein n=1 Tax=Enterococcus sp. AZ196 TaxID=2774659 RepID=UPI003D266904
MKEIRNVVLSNKVNSLVSFIDSATPEERLELADEIHKVYLRMGSDAGKEMMQDLEKYARNGEQKKPTPVPAEVSK